MIVRFTPRAVGDIGAITDYIKARNPQVSVHVEDAITGSIDHLADHPNFGVARPHLGVRAPGIPRFPYTIYYRVDPDAVVNIHIRDNRRRALRASDL